MSQSILTVSQSDFERSVFMMSIGQLRSLIRGIYEFKTGRRMEQNEIMDIERKESKIWKEFQRRGYLKTGEGVELQKWCNSFRQKRMF